MIERRTYDYGDGWGREVVLNHGGSETQVLSDSAAPVPPPPKVWIPPPPEIHTPAQPRPYGFPYPAGLGVSRVIGDFDFETRSSAGMLLDVPAQKWRPLPGATKRGLAVVGAPAYSEHPSTEVLCMAYDLKDGAGPRQWVPGMPNPHDLFAYLAAGHLLEAWNIGFERLIWRNVCRRLYGWPELPEAQLRCAMAKSRAHGLAGKLAVTGEVLRVATEKDKDGKRLLDKFSVPRNATKTDARLWITPAEDPVDGPRLLAYNITDIAAEAEISRLVPDLEGEELAFWQADQAINVRGVQIDVVGVHNCIAIIEQAHQQYNAELQALTGGTVRAASELAKLSGWLGAQGVVMAAMDEDAITDALAGEMPAAARRALEIRAAIGSASVKKTYAMANQVCADGRLRDLFSYHAAGTGRPTGNGPQPTNLPKAGPKVYRCGSCGKHSSAADICRWCYAPRPAGARTVEWSVDGAEDALDVIATRSLSAVEHVFGDAMLAVSGSLRSLFIARDGYDLISNDFTAIEAVVLAALAGEQWRLQVFRDKTDIYLESISRSTGTSLEELLAFKRERGMHHPLRQKGKIQELSLGYMGWINALRAFGAEGTDDELKQQVLAWRAASPAVVHFAGGQRKDWQAHMHGLEGMAMQAVQCPGHWFPVLRLDGGATGVRYGQFGDVLYCELPSGRRIAYHRPRLRDTGTWRGLELTYEGYNTNQKKGAPGWQVMPLYAGVLANNVVQGTARDIQRHAILALERGGYPVVLHIYDEDVSEVPQQWGSDAEFERLMGTMPDWAAGWPIGLGDTWRGRRYRKA